MSTKQQHEALREAAQAVIDRWETPLWKDVPATAEYIAALRDALEADHFEDKLDMVARWYMVNRDGAATLCVDREDAEHEAKNADLAWQNLAPHRAVQLVEVGTSAAELHPSPPEGMVIVPSEPTEAMKAAAVTYANGSEVYKNVTADVLRIEESIYGEVYEAMIAAAPPNTPAGSGKGGES